MGAITDQWFMKPSGKTEHLMFRHGTIIKTKPTDKKEEIVKAKDYSQSIQAIDQMIAELEELRVLRRLPLEQQFDKLDEAEEDEHDLDSDELLKKRRLEKDKTPDDNDHIEQSKSRYSVLEYHQGSISGDKFMQKLKGNYQFSEDGDQLMKNLGVTND